jgi:hypothetical protein
MSIHRVGEATAVVKESVNSDANCLFNAKTPSFETLRAVANLPARLGEGVMSDV